MAVSGVGRPRRSRRTLRRRRPPPPPPPRHRAADLRHRRSGDPRHLLGRDARQVGRRRRRRLQLPHLASADRSDRLRLRARARRQPGLDRRTPRLPRRRCGSATSAAGIPMPGEPNGHEEPHEGFKVFIANPGDVNDEGRVNRVYSRSVFHMGTGGPKRFGMQQHSAEIRVIHPEFGLKAFTQLMMNTGGIGRGLRSAGARPRSRTSSHSTSRRSAAPSWAARYEIWSTEASGARAQRPRGLPRRSPRRRCSTRSPCSIRPTRPSWSTPGIRGWRRSSSSNDNWSVNPRLRPRELRAAGLLEQQRRPDHLLHRPDGPASGRVASVCAGAGDLRLEPIGAPATTDGLGQFKMRRNYCQQRSRLGLKN